jgi:hypothetical protein
LGFRMEPQTRGEQWSHLEQAEPQTMFRQTRQQLAPEF